MPVDFVGLSYEVQQLADPSFFSAQNSGVFLMLRSGVDVTGNYVFPVILEPI
jgi:hypothetical protein